MTTKPYRVCSYSGCKTLVVDNYRCKAHALIEEKADRQRRGSANDRGYTASWQKAAKAFLRNNPLCQCQDCQAGLKRLTPATVVDHRIPHKGNRDLFWDVSNWQSMSKRCHDRKTALYDGAFGHEQTNNAINTDIYQQNDMSFNSMFCRSIAHGEGG